MQIYRCYFLDSEQRITAAEDLEAEAFSEVIDRALASLKARPQHRSVEVWLGGRRLYLAEREAA